MQRFEIVIRSDDKNDKDAECAIYIDGANVTRRSLEPGKRDVISGLRLNERTVLPFVFANVHYAGNILNTPQVSNQSAENQSVDDANESPLLLQSRVTHGEIRLEIGLGYLFKPPRKKRRYAVVEDEEERCDETRGLVIRPTNDESKTVDFHTVTSVLPTMFHKVFLFRSLDLCSLGAEVIPINPPDDLWKLHQTEDEASKPHVIFRFLYRPRGNV